MGERVNRQPAKQQSSSSGGNERVREHHTVNKRAKLEIATEDASTKKEKKKTN